MIFRVWRGQTSSANAAAYVRHLRERVFPALENIAGYQGVHLLRRKTEGGVEFQVMTKWESMPAVTAFAGKQVERAVVEPQARALLTEFDEFVRHYELVYESAGEK